MQGARPSAADPIWPGASDNALPLGPYQSVFKYKTVDFQVVSKSLAPAGFPAGFQTAGSSKDPRVQVSPCPAAARTGRAGLRVVVDEVAGSSGGRGSGSGSGGSNTSESRSARDATWVQAQAPAEVLLPHRLYSFCVWARLARAASSRERVATLIRLVALPSNATIASSAPVTKLSPNVASITPRWRQLCLHSVHVEGPEPLWARFVVDLGVLPHAEYHLDDSSLSYYSLDTDWDEPARVAARIEAHRQADVRLVFRGAGGAELGPGSLVRLDVALQRHAFLFGTALEVSSVAEEDRDWYMRTAADLFNAVAPSFRVFWSHMEPRLGDVYEGRRALDELLKAASAVGLDRVRGHALEWDHLDFREHWSRLQGCHEYLRALERRIRRDVRYLSGRVQSYDVINEPALHRRFMTGCGLVANVTLQAFLWAAQADPSARLCLNEYNTIGGYDNRLRQVVATVRWLQGHKAPIHCIGVQAYFRPGFITPGRLKFELDQLLALRLPITISEFLFRSGRGKVSTLDEAQQAAWLARWVPLWFSHPAVSGIYMWGFWDPQVYVKNAGLYYANKTPKAAARVMRELVRVTWNTSVSAGAAQLHDATGGGRGGGGERGFQFRGFYGRYRYHAVAASGEEYVGAFEVPAPEPHRAGAAGVLHTVLVTLPGEAGAGWRGVARAADGSSGSGSLNGEVGSSIASQPDGGAAAADLMAAVPGRRSRRPVGGWAPSEAGAAGGGAWVSGTKWWRHGVAVWGAGGLVATAAAGAACRWLVRWRRARMGHVAAPTLRHRHY